MRAPAPLQRALHPTWNHNQTVLSAAKKGAKCVGARITGVPGVALAGGTPQERQTWIGFAAEPVLPQAGIEPFME